jgi:hypothetical protein
VFFFVKKPRQDQTKTCGCLIVGQLAAAADGDDHDDGGTSPTGSTDGQQLPCAGCGEPPAFLIFAHIVIIASCERSGHRSGCCVRCALFCCCWRCGLILSFEQQFPVLF